MSEQENAQHFFGIDLAKKESQLCVLDRDGAVLRQKRFVSTVAAFERIAAEATDADTIAFEMTTNSFAVARLFARTTTARVIVSNPMQTKLIAASKNKSDKIDARVLADLARVGYLPEVWIPDERCESLRRLVSRRANLVSRRTAVKNDVHSILHRNLIDYRVSDLFGATGLRTLGEAPLPVLERMLVADYLDEIEDLGTRIGRSEESIAAFVCADPELLRQIDLLMTIEGIAVVGAAGILSAIGDIARFDSPKKIASYFGLTPSNYQSGDLRTFHGRITKQGRAEARWFLSEAAESLIRSPSPLERLFRRVAKKKGHNVAKIAVARKMAELIWHLLTKNEPYLYQKPRLTQEKQARLRDMARKRGVESESAAPKRRPGKHALQGLGADTTGRKLKTDIAREAISRATAAYDDFLARRRNKAVFNPIKPTQHDYERLLREVIAELLPERTAALGN